jgi:hypothetical protein
MLSENGGELGGNCARNSLGKRSSCTVTAGRALTLFLTHIKSQICEKGDNEIAYNESYLCFSVIGHDFVRTGIFTEEFRNATDNKFSRQWELKP